MTLESRTAAKWISEAVAAFEKDGGKDLVGPASSVRESPQLPKEVIRLPTDTTRWPNTCRVLPGIAARLVERQRKDQCQSTEERQTKGPKEGIEDDLHHGLHVPRKKLADAFLFYSNSRQGIPPGLRRAIHGELLENVVLKDSRTRTWPKEQLRLQACAMLALMYDYLKQKNEPDSQKAAIGIVAEYMEIKEDTVDSWWKLLNRNLASK